MLSVPPSIGPDGQLQLHASTVLASGKAVAFLGPSGCGKSSLAFGLMAQGARLIADDITWLSPAPEGPVAFCPETIKGRIEAWGVGVLPAEPAMPAPLALIVDLGRVQKTRHPDPLYVQLLGHDVPVLHKVDTPYFAAIILHYLSDHTPLKAAD